MITVHVAGKMNDNIQCCSNCGTVLKNFQVGGYGSPYPLGSFVEVGPGWQSLELSVKSHTCSPEAPCSSA